MAIALQPKATIVIAIINIKIKKKAKNGKSMIKELKPVGTEELGA